MIEDPKKRREILLITRPEGTEEAADKWSKIERVSKTLSVAAIPLVLAFGGWFVQRQIQNQTVSKDYVQLAVSILREPHPSKVSPELRAWAVDLLNEHSTIKLNEQVSEQLKSGEAVLPPPESFTAIPSAELTSYLQDKMQKTLINFQSYLKDSGFSIASGEVKYKVLPGETINFAGVNYYSLYDPKEKTMMVASKHADDTDLIMHEYMRHVLNPNKDTPIPYNDQRWWAYHAIDSGLAVYFPCSFNDRPVFAEGSKVDFLKFDLKNQKSFGIRPDGMDEANAVGHQVWGGAFWELRDKIGKPATDKLLASSWTSWKPSASQSDLFAEFVRKLIEVDQSQGGRNVVTIQEIFRRRGLQI